MSLDKAIQSIQFGWNSPNKITLKDLTNVPGTSRELHTAMPLSAQVMEMMQTLIADSYSEIDHGGLALFYEKLNSISLRKD